MRLPGAPDVAYRGDSLHLEDLRPRRAGAALRHAALRLFHGGRCARALSAYQRALAGRDHLVCYAVKANSNLAVLQWFAAAGCGFDIVSGGELERVLAAGGDADADRLLGRRQDPRRDARRRSTPACCCFNVESDGELESLSTRRRGQRPDARRCQPARQSRRRRRDPSLHLDRPARQQVRHRARRRARAPTAAPRSLPGLEVVGIDCHIGSQITEIAPYLEALDRLLDLVETLEAEGIAIAHLDLGGGLGITYTDETPPDAEELVRRLLERIDARGHGDRKLLFEPGRSLVGNAGVLVSEVLYLKPGETQELLHRRCGDERPDAAGDVRRLDADRRMRARPGRGAGVRRRRPDLRIGRLARPRPGARRARPATHSPCSRPAPTR